MCFSIIVYHTKYGITIFSMYHSHWKSMWSPDISKMWRRPSSSRCLSPSQSSWYRDKSRRGWVNISWPNMSFSITFNFMILCSTWQVPSKVRWGVGYDGGVFSPLDQDHVLQLHQVGSVALILLISLIVDIRQVGGAGDESCSVEWIMPVLCRGDHVCQDWWHIFKWFFIVTLDPGNISSLRQESPDEFTEQSWSSAGLTRGHSEHSLVRWPEGDKVSKIFLNK